MTERRKREVILAESAGFCLGVQEAIETICREVEESKDAIYSYGVIIHNKEVVQDLTGRGVVVSEGEDAMAKVCVLPEEAGAIILRSHGVGPEAYRLYGEKKSRIVGTVCPFVSRTHRIAQIESRKGRHVLIVGDPKHPEVEGVRTWGRADMAVVRDEEEFLVLRILRSVPLSVVAQTTLCLPKFRMLVDRIRELGHDMACLNTICNTTQEKQAEAKRIASEVGTVAVIGGKNSPNTKKLVEVCSAACPHTFHVRTAGKLDPELLAPFQRIGITVGVSIPKHIIEEA